MKKTALFILISLLGSSLMASDFDPVSIEKAESMTCIAKKIVASQTQETLYKYSPEDKSRYVHLDVSEHGRKIGKMHYSGNDQDGFLVYENSGYEKYRFTLGAKESVEESTTYIAHFIDLEYNRYTSFICTPMIKK